MTKDKLLELYELYKKGEITKEKISELRTVTNEDIDIILKSKRSYEIQKLLESKNFKSQPKEVQEKVINIIENCHASSLKIIFALSIAINENAIATGHILELIGIILRAKTDRTASKAADLINHKNGNISGHIVELAKLVSKCEEIEQAEFGVYAAIDSSIARTGKTVEIVKSICKAKNKQEAVEIYNQALMESRKINLLEALSKGHVSEISFWELFKDDPDKAIRFINEVTVNTEENTIYANGQEILAHARIRKRKK